MKKYSRKALIRFFSKLPPRSRPCKDGLCPIATMLGLPPGDYRGRSNHKAAQRDRLLAQEFDIQTMNAMGYPLTAARIVRIAKSLG
jgi:hypothetical protein